MIIHNNAHYAQALRRASEAIKEKAKHDEAELTPTQFDELIPITHGFGPDKEKVVSMIDAFDEKDEPIDFAELAEYIRSRRQLDYDKHGVLLDPIDDAPFIPERDDVVYYMDSAQVERHLDELTEAGIGATEIAQTVSIDFLKENKGHFIELGVKKSTINKRLFRSNVAKMLGKKKQ